jgi:hypothetical protein
MHFCVFKTHDKKPPFLGTRVGRAKFSPAHDRQLGTVGSQNVRLPHAGAEVPPSSALEGGAAASLRRDLETKQVVAAGPQVADRLRLRLVYYGNSAYYFDQ